MHQDACCSQKRGAAANPQRQRRGESMQTIWPVKITGADSTEISDDVGVYVYTYIYACTHTHIHKHVYIKERSKESKVK